MNKKEWARLYMSRIKERTGMSVQDALALFEAGRDNHDYETNPIESADIELSYWSD